MSGAGRHDGERPEERFAPRDQLLDLRAAIEELRSELAGQGHRQRVLYRHGPVTLALFAFTAGGGLPEHVVADGVVTIQGLSGELFVGTAESAYDLRAGGLVVLAPGVRHDVKALADSAMLVSIYREPSSAP